MKLVEVREMPDVPELQEKLFALVKEMGDLLTPAMAKSEPNLNINALLLVVSTYACYRCKNQEEVDEVIDGIYKATKVNMSRYFEARNEVEGI